MQQTWQLVSIDKQAVDKSITSTLNIAKNGKATGNLACNNFFGTFELQEKTAKIVAMGSTRKICLDLQNTVEQQVTTVFTDWSEVQLKDDSLTFIGQAHQLTYKLIAK
ncbi:META domain-containing protein [Psychromonas sp. MME2]|uniref:META domain-containing protein n=1 Tax=Psychromonas sp. MME2 TaxID=3231033 RepID=UPI00339CA9AF